MELSLGYRIVLSAVLLLIAALVGGDAAADWRAGGSLRHIMVELCVSLLALAGVALVWLQNLILKTNLARAHREIGKVREEALRWREEHAALLKGLGTAIDQQLVAWGLTPAECEITLLLLKGLSMKEIAEVRTTSERTVRQQTLAVYSKSGLAGRAELSAFFLEDILAPREKNIK